MYVSTQDQWYAVQGLLYVFRLHQSYAKDLCRLLYVSQLHD